MNPVLKAYKILKYRKDLYTQDFISKLFLITASFNLFTSVYQYFLPKYYPSFLYGVPYVILITQVFYFRNFFRVQKQEERELPKRINSHEYYMEEIEYGWIISEKIKYTDYVEQKMYLSYPLKSWTPIWEKIK